MRILFCNKYNFPFSGTEVYLFDLMALLRAQGHEVALFSMSDPRGRATPYDQHFVPHLDFKDVHGWVRSAQAAAHAIYSLEARRRLRSMIADFRPDVAHVRNIYHHLSPAIFWELRTQEVPVLYHINDFNLLCPNYNFVSHGSNCERCANGGFWQVIQAGCYSGSRFQAGVLAAEAYVHKWMKTYRQCVDLFLAPSEFVKLKLMQYGWEENIIRVLPHFQRISSPATPPQPGAPILYFGRLSAEKGVDDLLRAMQANPSIDLLIAGDGPERAKLEDLKRTLNLQNVTFLGHVEPSRIQELIASSLFTVLPSHAYETLGKTILESYALARPVIASDLGSRREFVEHEKTGLLYPPGDCQALGESIARLAAQPDLVVSMGAAGHERVARGHAPEAHAAALSALYGELVRTGASLTGSGLRVAFIGGRGLVSRYSGIESYCEEVGGRLAARGHEVTVYCRRYFTPELQAYRGMKIVRLPTIRTKHLDTFVHTLLSTAHALFQGYDVVHYQALGPSLFSFLPRLSRAKTIVTVQGLDWQRKKWNAFARFVLRVAEKTSALFPNLTVTVSRTLHKYYEERHKKQTTYIPNGTAIVPRRAGPCLQNWGLHPNRYVLYLGRFSAEKNCHLLIEAFERLNTSFKLALAGGSSHSDDYVAGLRKHASDRIVFLDWVSGESLQELLTNAALFVLPSDLEGLSLALLDAMAAGVCVLTSDIAENRELTDGAGFTFCAGDIADLAGKLEFLISDPELRRAMAERARQKISTGYLWEQVTDQIEKLYYELLRKQQPVRSAAGRRQLPAA